MINERLQKRQARGLLRKLTTRVGLIDLTSNDYFGFAKENRIYEATPGSTGSRLLTGNTPFYEELEKYIAEYHKAQSCLIFNSGYTANLGLLSALGTPDVTFLYDLDIHASMIDGVRLSDAKKFPFRHNDLASLERRLQKAVPPVYVLIESLYSISGDLAPLEEIAKLCNQYGASLIVDEAHTTGICGAYGEGRVCELNLESKVFARIHTFSKALGVHGACVLGSSILKEYLINFSRPLIYTTALPSSVLQDIRCSYEKLKQEAAVHQKKLQEIIEYFCKKAKIKATCSPIQPLFVQGIDTVRSLSETLCKKGLDVRAIVPPTVPKGKECLRVVLHSFNKESDIDCLMEVIG